MGEVHPFYEGVRARTDGADEYANPYQEQDWRRDAWQHGWEVTDELIAFEQPAAIRRGEPMREW